MSVSIVTPTFNRKRFERLLEYNINSQTYYNIKEIIILDDSDIDRPLCIRSVRSEERR
jgi:glycosyltransferase involved in cell wall biosynthesis